MARINGVNSDYILLPDGSIGPNPNTEVDLEMKLFICPHEADNALEATSGYCEGTHDSCPIAEDGHAMVRFHEVDGLSLVAGRENEIRLDQNGAAAGTILLHPGVEDVQNSPEDGKVQVEGRLVVVAGGHTITITPSASGITLAHTNGAKVVFKPNGDIDLNTKNNTGTVNIQGNLVVSGTLSRQGQII